MRRVDINGGNLTLMDYCTAGPQYASGGFIADSPDRLRHQRLAAAVPRARQQHRRLVERRLEPGLLRRRRAPRRSRSPRRPAVHHAGDRPRSAARSRSCTSTRRARTASSCPRCARNSVGHDLGRRARPPARSIPLDRVLRRQARRTRRRRSTPRSPRARTCSSPPASTTSTRRIKVKRADTVVLGLGLATLDRRQRRRRDDGRRRARASSSPACCSTPARSNSPVLLQVGTGRHGAARADAADPTSLQDVFFRIGGAARRQGHDQPGGQQRQRRSSTTSGPGAPTTATGVGWTVNTADTGVVVNGDDVTATGLFVEHYQKYNVIWNGERGRTIFFQNEMPYDPPNQAAWQHDGVNGYAAYKVADSVQTHEAWGLGSYCFFNVDPTIHADARLRGAGHAGRAAARPADRLPRRRRHHRPRRQRHRRGGGCLESGDERRRLPVT